MSRNLQHRQKLVAQPNHLPSHHARVGFLLRPIARIQFHYTQELIIPSLTLPSALKQPTPYGKTLGSLRLIYLSRSSKGTSSAENFTIQLLDTPDIVDIGSWEQTDYGRLMRASTDWIEHYDPHGLEKFEPSRNVEIIEIPGYDQNDNIHEMLRRIKSLIQEPFHTLSDVFVHKPQSTLVAQLLSASSSPLFNALILALPPSPSNIEEEIIDALASQIPVILLHRPSSRHHYRTIQKLASFRPSTVMALRTGLFRSPDTISSLRLEAAERFLEWREVEETVGAIQKRRRKRQTLVTLSKASWESELESQLSQQVAMRLRDEVLAPPPEDNLLPDVSLDPLHLRSLFFFSLSLLGPLQSQISRAAINALDAICSCQVELAVIGGFCVGVGAGICIMR